MKKGKWWCKTPKQLITALAIEQPFFLLIDSFPRSRKPGEIISRLPKRERELLEKLKSDDIKDVRPLIRKSS